MTSKEIVKGFLATDRVLTESSDIARELYNQSRFGELLDSGQVQLSIIESFYLIEKKRLDVVDGRNKVIELDKFLKKANKLVKNFWIRYLVFKDMRDRGYIVKTALKFGADFRIYDRGVKPGEDHAKWILYPVAESSGLTWHDFSSKNRVAHSTKKKLLIGIVDDECSCTYYQVGWIRP
jgi:tRNA-intron endonuclease, archaea type